MLRFAVDEDFDNRIVRGLLRLCQHSISFARRMQV